MSDAAKPADWRQNNTTLLERQLEGLLKNWLRVQEAMERVITAYEDNKEVTSERIRFVYWLFEWAINSVASSGIPYAFGEPLHDVQKSTRQILQEAKSLNSYIASVQNAENPGARLSDLASAQESATKISSQLKATIESMKYTGYYPRSVINTAEHDLQAVNAVSDDIASSLQDAKSWDASKAAYDEAEADEKSLSQAISQTEEQLKNLKFLEAELELDARILSEPFPSLAAAGGIHAASASYSLHFAKHVPTPAKPQSSAIQTPAAPSEKLAATGSNTQDIWIASAALLACGIAAEAIKKGRERRSRGK